MENLTFYIVDVFAEEKYAGNQLAVVTGAGGLSDGEMQHIAQEMHFSETTFVLSDAPRNGGYDVRIFTPAQEVPFAGHPTLGTAYVIQREIVKASVETIVLNLKVGQIPVTFARTGVLWMQQKPPIFGQIFDPEPIARALGLPVQEIDERFPIQEVSTGLPFIIVPLRTLAALRQSRIAPAKAVLLFCPETRHRENDLSVRVFADYYGVPEDPATGSANGCLAGYLVKHRYFGQDRIKVRVEQGYEIGRPSRLFLEAEGRADTIAICVGGQVVMVARGELV